MSFSIDRNDDEHRQRLILVDETKDTCDTRRTVLTFSIDVNTGAVSVSIEDTINGGELVEAGFYIPRAYALAELGGFLLQASRLRDRVAPKRVTD